MAKIENKDIIEALKEKTILEVKELVDMMKEEKNGLWEITTTTINN